MPVKIKPLELNTDQSLSFSLLTAPKFRCCLKGVDPDNISCATIIAIGAYLEDGNPDGTPYETPDGTPDGNPDGTPDRTPVGLGLAAVYGDTHMGEIFSLYIEEKYRNQKLGSQILQQLETECQKAEATYLIFNFPFEIPSFPYFAKLLSKMGWSEPEVFMEQFVGDCLTLNAKWHDQTDQKNETNQRKNLPPGYTEFPWRKLTAGEREIIEHQFEQGWFNAGVYPFRDEKHIEPLNSIGLRYTFVNPETKKKETQVVGWNITHRVAPDMIKYSALYIQKEHRIRINPIRLTSDAIRLQQKAGIPWSLLEIRLDTADKSWVNFVHRKIKPHIVETPYIYQSWKTFI